MRLLVLNIVLFLASFIVWGQKEFIQLEVSPNPVEKDQQLSITIKTNVEGPIELDFPDEFEQSGATQSGMSSSVNYVNGKAKVVSFSYQKIAGHFEDEGVYSLGPAKIMGVNGIVESNVVSIKVRKRQNMISENPAENMHQAIFGIIEQSAKEVYEGQPVVLEGKVYSQVDILQVERYMPFEMDGPAESHELSQANQVMKSYEQVSGRNVITFRIGKRLIFPEKIGTYEIDPFETILYYDDQRSLFPERVKIRSNESMIKIKPLPDGVPANFIEGVGSYQLNASIDSNTIKQGGVITLKVNISGFGNLHNVEAPQLKLPKGMILYGDPEVDDSISFTAKGAEGVKTFTYYIQANVPGSIRIPTIEAAYFELGSEEYITLQADLPVIQVIPSDDAVAMVNDKEEVQKQTVEMMPPVPYDNQVMPEKSFFSGLKGGLMGCAPIALALLLAGVVRMRKSTENERMLKQQLEIKKREVIEELEQLKNQEDNIEGLQRAKKAIQHFLSITFRVDPLKVTATSIIDYAPDYLTKEDAKEVAIIFRKIDELRYSGGAIQADVVEIIEKAKSIVRNV